jgi:hypothetical protein
VSRFLISGLLILSVAATAVATDDMPPYKITTKRDNDRVEVKIEKDKVVFSVQSPIGISNAVIERAGEKWPDTVVLRLHLKGLENFKITTGKVTLEGSASLQDGRHWSSRQRPNDRLRPSLGESEQRHREGPEPIRPGRSKLCHRRIGRCSASGQERMCGRSSCILAFKFTLASHPQPQAP